MSENSNPTVQFALRMDPGLRDRIKSAAAENNRSMNAEIVATLEDAYPEPSELQDAIFTLNVLSQQLAAAEATDEEKQILRKRVDLVMDKVASLLHDD